MREDRRGIPDWARRLFRIAIRRPELTRDDLDAELAFHVEARAEQLRRRGMSAEDAEREAMRRLGVPIDRVTSQLRHAANQRERRMALHERIDDFAHDIRYAARGLAHRPGFTAVAVVTLALGIGANTAIFSVADALIFRPPPYPDPRQLVSVWPEQTHVAGEYLDLRARADAYTQMASYAEWEMTLGNDEASFRADGADVSDNFFAVFGVGAAHGRTFASGASKPGTPREAVLSDALWRARFGADSGVVGRTMQFEGSPVRVVGVMPPGFHFPDVATQIWVTSTFDPAQVGNYWGWPKFSMVGRLKPGVTPSSARTELATLMPGFRTGNPVWHHTPDYGVTADAVPLQAQLAGPARTTLLTLLVVVFALLLIACANVANLILVRSLARRREFAVRTALGCSKGRMVRQVLTEAVVLATAGGMAALGLAWGGVRALSANLPPQLPRTAPIGIDWRVLAFTFALVMMAGVVFGLWPALRAIGRGAGQRLAGTRGASSGGDQRVLSSALTVIQLALAVVLVTGSGLLLRSLDALGRVPTGFAADRVVAARVTLPGASYRDTSRRAAFFDALLAQLQGEAGTSSAAAVDRLPLRGPVYGMAVRVEGSAEDVTGVLPLVMHAQVVTNGYFATMGIPVVSGRAFGPEDRAESAGTVIVSRAAARLLWPGQDPVGRHVGAPYKSPWWTVIGVAADIQQDSLSGTDEATIYRPMSQAATTDMTVLARTSGDAASFGAAVTRVVAALDRTVPVTDMRTMRSVVDTSLARARFTATLLTAFAALALVLALVGVYGVLSSLVAQRTREIGVRLALGATPSGVLRFVLGRGAALALAGVAIGVATSLAAGRAISGLLYGVSAQDALTLSVAPALLFVVALLATLLPARRATRVDPVSALRAE